MKQSTLRLPQFEKIILFIIQFLGASLIRLMGSTWQVFWPNRDIENNLKKKYGGVIFAFWHSQILIPAFTHRNRQIRIMISQSNDGEYIARTVKRLGFVPIRGSSSRRGLRALNELVKEGKYKQDLAITPDGPRGPRFKAQIGVVILSKRSGLPIIPCGISAKKRKELNSWDRFCIPYFFTKIAFIYGQPIHISRNINKRQLEIKRQEIESVMQDVQRQAEEYFN